MLRLVSLFGAVVYAGPSDPAIVFNDDDINPTNQRVRVSFRGSDNEPSGTAYVACGCDDNGGFTGTYISGGNYADCRQVDVATTTRNKNSQPTGSGGGMGATYNSSTGIQTIKNRGGYGNGESQSLTLFGPGTLYTVHLDVEPRNDRIQISQTGHETVVLTGNYSACLRHSTGLEGRYMNGNLAIDNHYNAPDYHSTTETQNEDKTGSSDADLCHQILTGKLLMPAPVEIGDQATLQWVSDGDGAGGAVDPVNPDGQSDFYEGFELLMHHSDLYTVDISTTEDHVCIGEKKASGVSCDAAGCTDVSECNDGGAQLCRIMKDGTKIQTEQITLWAGAEHEGYPASLPACPPAAAAGQTCLPPEGHPKAVYFKDTNLNKLKVAGTIEITANDDTDEPWNYERAYKITLEKYEPAGRWGYILGQLADADEFDTTARTRDDLPYGETTVHGPVDSDDGVLGNGAASAGSYYPTGGSTGTAAPNLLGGGPPGARVFNKHGDVIPGSARGMHPDYMTAEELIEVESWTCDCSGDNSNSAMCTGLSKNTCSTTISRTSGEANGAGLQASQGSPPAPTYYLRVRSCRGTNTEGGAVVAWACNERNSTSIQLIDIAEYEPKATFFGDLDPKTRVLQGEITVVSPSYAMGLRGYRAYPTSDGDSNLPLRWSDDVVRDCSAAEDAADTHATNENALTEIYTEPAGATWNGADAILANAKTKGLPNPQFMEVLRNHCPPDSSNADWARWCDSQDLPTGVGSSPEWCAMAKEPCGNDSPYSPKCTGKTCALINILPGSQGEYYISRYDNNGNANNPQTQIGSESGETTLPRPYTANTAQRNYSHNEHAHIYLPKAGWLTPIMMDVNEDGSPGDSLTLNTCPTTPCPTDMNVDLVAKPLSQYIDIWAEESVITWVTDEADTAHGWTLIFQPDYPEIEMALGSPMAQASSGFRIVPVYHANPTLQPWNEKPTDDGGEEDGELGEACQRCSCVGCATEGSTNADTYVETFDWLVPNVTCTPTTMHCPLPSTWAHINYTTPSLYPEPAEGSCLQQKTGTSSLSGCSEKKDLDERWYSANSPTTAGPSQSQQNTDEEDNGQLVSEDTAGLKHANWAGNCGGATSYFWFEKIACGSTRTFLTDRSLIEDFVQLTPTWEDIQQILDLYYTTKAPLTGTSVDADPNVSDGFTFITADYHIAPVLPPKVNCTCHAAMDAYASLLSVVSKTPQPGAPVTLDPEVLNTGTSKIVATLRMYQDPTYSIPASSVALMPIVVTRFYLEVSTKFTRNRITISDCSASNKENLLNQTSSLKPRQNYCDNSTFDTKAERSPNGVTHMDRMSMKKFKFQSTTDVFMQCKIRACAQQPCGICTGTGDAYRELQDVDLAPIEGEMYAPTIGVRVAPNDMNALTFPDTVPTFQPVSSTGPTASIGQATQNDRPATTKPIQIASNLVLSSVTASWAIQNREAVTETLRNTMGLTAQEELVITSISKLGRKLSEEKRSLQSGGVKIDFVIGVSDSARAAITETKVTQLASGSPALAMQFSSALDQALMRRGQPAARLPTNAMAFSAPTKTENRAYSPQATQVYSNNGAHYNQQMAAQNSNSDANDSSSESGSDNLILGLVVGAFAMGVMGVLMFLHFSKQKQQQEEYYTQEESPDLYASKVAALDQNWQQEGMDQSAW